MSHYRRLSGGRRDGNEPEIRSAFARHGWHTEQLSGTAIPDLMCFPPQDGKRGATACVLVDVKAATGKVEPEQAKKWAELATKGIPVYVARTWADVDAIVSGKAEPWRPTGKTQLKSAFRCPHGSECTRGCSG